jgi:hypothetical protein
VGCGAGYAHLGDGASSRRFARSYHESTVPYAHLLTPLAHPRPTHPHLALLCHTPTQPDPNPRVDIFSNPWAFFLLRWQLEYKYIVRSGFSGSREVTWQPGPNNMLATNRHAVITMEDSCKSQHPRDVWSGSG